MRCKSERRIISVPNETLLGRQTNFDYPHSCAVSLSQIVSVVTKK